MFNWLVFINFVSLNEIESKMKKRLLTDNGIFIVAAASLLLLSCEKDEEVKPQAEVPTAPKAIVADQFKTDASGWTIVGDAQGGFVAASYSPDGGVTDGHIFAKDDVLGGYWYFAAPDTYKGNKTSYYGATLNYSIYQECAMSDQREKEDIFFKSGSKQVFFLLDSFPKTTWTNYSIKIDTTAAWYTGSINSKTKASKQDIMEVLENVTDFWIRGEFEHGPDEGGLDDVEIIK